MIRAEELMIGDWVHSKDYNENLRVLEINCDYITLGEGFLHDYKDIEPSFHVVTLKCHAQILSMTALVAKGNLAVVAALLQQIKLRRNNDNI